jgi:ketosteroid isomerase-like protein
MDRAARHPDPRARRVVEAFETLEPAALAQLDALYTPDARFRDPFNELRGVAAIRGLFGHMFDTLDDPRFLIRDIVVDGDQAFLTWDFVFRMKRWRRGEQRIHGGSHLRFAPDGRIAEHRDYWDAAEELYAKLPVIGALMRWLRARAAG